MARDRHGRAAGDDDCHVERKMKRLGITVLSTSLVAGISLAAIGLTVAQPKKTPTPTPTPVKPADPKATPGKPTPSMNMTDWWVSPTTGQPTWERPAMPEGKEGELIKYGMELTKDTYKLLGPTSKT